VPGLEVSPAIIEAGQLLPQIHNLEIHNLEIHESAARPWRSSLRRHPSVPSRARTSGVGDRSPADLSNSVDPSVRRKPSRSQTQFIRDKEMTRLQQFTDLHQLDTITVNERALGLRNAALITETMASASRISARRNCKTSPPWARCFAFTSRGRLLRSGIESFPKSP
jgi:hypothetical protein